MQCCNNLRSFPPIWEAAQRERHSPQQAEIAKRHDFPCFSHPFGLAESRKFIGQE